MKIAQLFRSDRPVFSFEFFPPKTEKATEDLYATAASLRDLQPDFVSVTYGAGGSTRAKTVEITRHIQNTIGLETMAHLTCVGSTREEIASVLDEHWANGVRNILALRGDPPGGQRAFKATEDGFGYANELTEFIASRYDFCIGTAGYPEGHPECLNLTRDVENLKRKIDAGASFIITQLFFDNADLLRFRDRCAAQGIHAPIVAGIMPILNLGQIKRFVTMCGSKIPHELLTRLEAHEADPATVERLGYDHAIAQCEGLIREGVGGVHFYTLNRSTATTEILTHLRGGSPATAAV